MQANEVIRILHKQLNYSEKNISDIKIFINDLIKANRKHNFISKNELRVFDEFFGESVIFKNYLSIVAEIVDNEFNDIKVAYQGCAEGRYCYPKMIKSL